MQKKTQKIDEWIHQRSSSFRWSSWLVYNEQVLHPAVSEELAVADEDVASVEKKKKEKVVSFNEHGHCKGILVWNASEIVWLVGSLRSNMAIFH
jgi:hypothetical protein